MPRHQGGADVERDLLEVAHDVDDAVLVVDAAGRGVGRVALRGHPLVPVVVRPGAVLDLHGLQPGVLARGLVEVAVDDDRAAGRHHRSSRLRRKSRRPPRGTTTRPEASTWKRRRSAAVSSPISVSAGMMLKRSTMARRSRAPFPTVVLSMMIESSTTAPSLTHTP